MDALLVIKIAKIVVTLAMCICAGVIVNYAMGKTNEFAMLSRDIIQKKIDNSQEADSYFNKSRLVTFLSEQGVMYRKNDYNYDPVVFIFEKTVLGIFLAIGVFILAPTFIFKITLAIIVFILGFFYPDLDAKSKNKADNLAMEDDIVTIYSTLKTEARAGVYIGDSLIDCQRSVTNKRLKAAMTELNNNILSRKVTMEEALTLFRMRFDNDQINDLADTIKQSFRTGKLVEMTKDISSQIEENNKLRYEAEKRRAKKASLMQSIAFFTGIILLVLYVTGIQLADKLSALW